MSTSHDPTSKPIPFYLSLTAGAGLILIMLALGIGVIQGAAADSTVVGVTFAAGIGLMLIGILGWFAVVQPSRHFDDINVPQYTGHHEEHHAEPHAEPAEESAIIPHG